MDSITPNPPLPRPPRLANRFLEWYCRPEVLEEIQGDAVELFFREAKKNKRKASWRFTWNVIRFFRWKNISKRKFSIHSTSFDMFKSYVLSGLRSLKRNAATSAINLIGLSVAIGCAIMIFMLEDSFYNLDTMHERGDRIGLVVNNVKEGDDVEVTARSPHPFKAMLEENTAVEMVARAGRSGANVRYGDLVFREPILFADPEFMQIFSFKMLAGDRNALKNKHSILISEALGVKYFGTDDPVGKALTVKFTDKDVFDLTVGGVMENSPANSSMYFDILVPSEVWLEMNQDKLEDWGYSRSVTFVSLKEDAKPEQLTASFASLKDVQNKANPERPIQNTRFLPLSKVAEESFDISGSLSWSNSPAAMVAFWVIGAFLIILASLNYMNISVATVTLRLKEIGIRKVVGSGKKEIIIQFLTENIVLCLLALGAGTLLCYYFLMPGFNSLFSVKIVFGVSTWYAGLAGFGGILLIVALLSGAYPAFYVSAFNAVHILKGKEKFGNKSWLSRILLTLQFTLSITIMVGSLVFIWSSYYVEGKDWGYNRDGVLGIQFNEPKQYEQFRQELAQNKNITTITGANGHVGKQTPDVNVKVEGNEYVSALFSVGPGYFELLNMKLKEGRLFDEKIESDKVESVIVNEAFVRKMGWASPLNQSFEMDSVKRFVVGVVRDFNYQMFMNPINPAIFTLSDGSDFNYLIARVEAGSIGATKEALESLWKKINPNDPHQVFVQNEVFDNFLNSNRSNNKVIYFIASVAVFLAAMGLYGLVAYNLTRRLKEFSVRKVFGANTSHIFRLMNSDYQWIVFIAFFVGAPLGAFLMNMLISSVYPFPMPVNYWPYIISISVMVLMVGLTIASQIRRVVHENPTETLRME